MTEEETTARGGERDGFRAALGRLEQAQKPGGGVPAYMRWVNRRAARVIAAAGYVIGLTPNAITAISAFCTAAGLAVLVIVPPSWSVGIVVAILTALGFAFDSADGQLARLTGRSSVAGEWLDHVVDAIRTPAVHICVASAILLSRPELGWLVPVAFCFAVLATGQFISQLLAEQLVRQRDAAVAEPSGVRKSFMLLPTDTGTLCWSFVLWGSPLAFGIAYTALFALNLVHAAASMRRKHRKLAAL